MTFVYAVLQGFAVGQVDSFVQVTYRLWVEGQLIGEGTTVNIPISFGDNEREVGRKIVEFVATDSGVSTHNVFLFSA
jgi:hypothetical protein